MNDTKHCFLSNRFDPDTNAIDVKTLISSDDFRFFEVIAKDRHNRDKAKIVVENKKRFNYLFEKTRKITKNTIMISIIKFIRDNFNKAH